MIVPDPNREPARPQPSPQHDSQLPPYAVYASSWGLSHVAQPLVAANNVIPINAKKPRDMSLPFFRGVDLDSWIKPRL